jgi:methylenetetrahydrofolate reductase (NADPH)
MHVIHLFEIQTDAFFSVLIQVQKSYYLVSLVDNDYSHGDLFAAFKEI